MKPSIAKTADLAANFAQDSFAFSTEVPSFWNNDAAA